MKIRLNKYLSEVGHCSRRNADKLIKEGKDQFIVETSIDKKGKFGRLLGTLYKDIDTIDSYNQILVNEGHAVEYFGGKK